MEKSSPWLHSSVMIVVEFHSEAYKIQYKVLCKCFGKDCQKLGTFLLNELWLEKNESNNFINESCSPNSIFCNNIKG